MITVLPMNNAENEAHRQAEILAFIEDYYLKWGTAPSLEEITGGTSYGAKSAVFYQIEKMREKGIIVTPGYGKKARGYVPTWLHSRIGEEIRRKQAQNTL